jgi:hypothetical protein
LCEVKTNRRLGKPPKEIYVANFVNSHEEGSVAHQMDEAIHNSTRGSVSGGGDWMTSGIMAIIFIVPIILAKIAGFIFALLSKIPVVGRIIQSIIVAIVGPTVLWLGAFSYAYGAKWAMAIPDFIIIFLIVCSVTLSALWFFLWHGDVVKLMNASEYSNSIKTSFAIAFFGYLIAGLFALGSKSLGTILTIVVFAIAIIVYFKNVKPYAHEAAKRRKKNPARAITMLVGLGVTVLISIIITGNIVGKETSGEAERAAKMEQMIKDDPRMAIVNQKTPFQAKVTAPMKGVIPSITGGIEIEIPAGSVVTVESFAKAGGNYVASIYFDEKVITADNVEYLELAK